jgi:pimeloyl-ACP methyl ester carboxylesterase
MSRIRTLFHRRKRLVLWLAALGFVALLAAVPVARPLVRKWRTGVREVSIGKARLSYRDSGTGSPAIVIISGMACHKDSYYPLHKSLADKTRVLSYDRPGLGDSTPTDEPRTLEYIDQDMTAFLKARNVPPPYVLIGHSLGGHIERYYAEKHPDDVAGLVFVDHPHEDWFRYIRSTWTPEESQKYFRFWMADNPGYEGTGTEELLAYEANCDLVRGMKIRPDMPVLMFTGSNDGHYRDSPPGRDADRKAWTDMQASLLEGVADAKHIVDWECGHMLHKDKPEMVESEIEAFIDRIRAKRGMK